MANFDIVALYDIARAGDLNKALQLIDSKEFLALPAATQRETFIELFASVPGDADNIAMLTQHSYFKQLTGPEKEEAFGMLFSKASRLSTQTAIELISMPEWKNIPQKQKTDAIISVLAAQAATDPSAQFLRDLNHPAVRELLSDPKQLAFAKSVGDRNTEHLISANTKTAFEQMIRSAAGAGNEFALQALLDHPTFKSILRKDDWALHKSLFKGLEAAAGQGEEKTALMLLDHPEIGKMDPFSRTLGLRNALWEAVANRQDEFLDTLVKSRAFQTLPNEQKADILGLGIEAAFMTENPDFAKRVLQSEAYTQLGHQEKSVVLAKLLQHMPEEEKIRFAEREDFRKLPDPLKLEVYGNAAGHLTAAQVEAVLASPLYTERFSDEQANFFSNAMFDVGMNNNVPVLTLLMNSRQFTALDAPDQLRVMKQITFALDSDTMVALLESKAFAGLPQADKLMLMKETAKTATFLSYDKYEDAVSPLTKLKAFTSLNEAEKKEVVAEAVAEAVKSGKLEATKHWLEACPALDIRATDKSGKSLMDYANALPESAMKHEMLQHLSEHEKRQQKDQKTSQALENSVEKTLADIGQSLHATGMRPDAWRYGGEAHVPGSTGNASSPADGRFQS